MTLKYLILIFIFPAFCFGQSKPYLNSLDKVNQKQITRSGQNTTKLHISKQDSSADLKANIRVDHRIFGYAQPNITSERLLLLSIFTLDVENNPFNCILGAYYDTHGLINIL